MTLWARVFPVVRREFCFFGCVGAPRRMVCAAGWGRTAADGLRCGLIPWRSALCADCAAVLAQGACRRTRCVHLRSLRSNSCGKLDHEARVSSHARRPLCCAPRRHGNRPQRRPSAAVDRLGVCKSRNRNAASSLGETVTPSKGKGACEPAWSCLWGAEKRRAPGRARAKTRALQDLACRSCLSGVNEVNGASSAAGRVPEHRREVCAKRRPPQWHDQAGSQAPLPAPKISAAQEKRKRRPRSGEQARQPCPRRKAHVQPALEKQLQQQHARRS